MKRFLLFFHLVVIGIVCFYSCEKQSFPLPPISINSKYPNLTETDRGLAIVWYEPIVEGHALKWSEFNGRSWSKPVIVTTGEEYFINWADFPSIFYNGKNHLVVHWLEKNGDGTYDYVVKVSQSFDRGRSWSRPIIPHKDNKLGEHGFVSFFNASNNKVGLVWLDGRNMMGEEHGHGYGQMNLYSTTIDKNGILGEEILLDDRVCECCPTSAVNIENDILVAYRDRSLSEIRNINLVRWNNSSWQKPHSLHNDNWKIAGCPVNGPKLAVTGNNVAAVWYTSPNENPIIYISFSKDGGKKFNSPIRIDNGNPIGRVDCIWLDSDRVLVSWMEMGEKSTNVIFSTVYIENHKGSSKIVTQILPGRSSGHPVISRYRQNIFLAWTEEDKIQSKWIHVN
ncbi:MAG: sialidase family protein [Candidatus Neomarinimicrobiota bacterium]|nr:sialidase family protein [Candidatus Neomarinimicrobiota bacterium]